MYKRMLENVHVCRLMTHLKSVSKSKHRSIFYSTFTQELFARLFILTLLRQLNLKLPANRFRR